MGRVIGIDLGTTNSCVAIIEDGHKRVIPNAEGSRTTPSVVGFSADGEEFIGQIARRQAMTNPTRTIYAVKRLIGRKFDDPEVAHARALCSYTISAAPNNDAWVRIDGRDWSPSEISARILAALRQVAEDFLGDPVAQAVITVPAYFNDAQRQATRDAGRIAGLDVLRIINEPTAAALAYGLALDGDEVIAVYDLGGGTFDISILQIGGGLIEVLATGGDTFLGGEDFDNCIIDTLAQAFEAEHGVDLRADKLSLQRLKEAAENAKQELSISTETQVQLPFIASDASGPKHLSRTLTRYELETLVGDLVERTLEPCARVLADAGLQKHEVTQVLLVGGSTRMPLVQRRVESFFGRVPSTGVNPDEVVAIGAATQGSILSGEIEEVVLLDVAPLTLGIETMGGTFTPVIERNAPIPTRASRIFSTTIDNQTMVSVHVLQGERPMAADNHSLARFELHGIPPAPRGLPQIEIAFNIDADGLVSVGAQDLATGQAQQIRVVASGGLSEQQIERMIRDAEANRAADVDRHARVEAINEIQGLLVTTRRSLSAGAELIPPDEATAFGAQLKAAQARLEGQPLDLAALTQLKAQVEATAHRLSEIMYGDMLLDLKDDAPS